MDEEKIADRPKNDKTSVHQINWRYNNEYDGNLYLKEKIEIDKFVFHNRDYLDLKKILLEMNDPKIKGPPPNLTDGFYISHKLTSEYNTEIHEEIENELKHILDLITLQTNCKFRLGFFQLDGTIKNADVRISKHFALSSNIVKSTLEVKKIIENMEKPKKERLKRAITWYSRGTLDTDIQNSFSNYWIAFEFLSYWFGEGEPSKCEHCGEKSSQASIRSTLKKFGKELKLSSEENKKIEELYILDPVLA